MKYRYLYFLIGALSLLAVSCHEENLYDTAVPELVKVTSGADLAFKACGGEGDIEIAPSDEKLEVITAQESWCHITVNGNKIHVVADEHIGLESRYAVLDLKCGNKSGKTIVHQFGIIVKSFDASDITLTNGAKEFVIEYDANETTIVAESDADWIHVDISPEALTISVDENTEVTESREGHVSWKFGQMKGVITVFQFDPEEAGMIGDWTLKFYQNKTAKITVTSTLAVNEDGTYTLSVNDTKTGLNLSFPVYFDKMDLCLPVGEKWGTYTTKTATYSMFCLLAPSTGNLAYGTAVNTGAFPLSMEKNGSGVWVGTGTAGGENGYFHLEGWSNDDHEGVSSVSLYYTSLVMQKK